MIQLFEVIEILNISRPLLELCSTPETPKDIHKVMVMIDGLHEILYMIDGCNFGPGTVLKIKRTTYFPIIYRIDYEIVKERPYRVNKELIKKLLNKLKENK